MQRPLVAVHSQPRSPHSLTPNLNCGASSIYTWRSSNRYESPSCFSLFSQTLLSLFTHIQQVEDTLNNSNELFLTFRKEMEEMSKKTKRLEKENLTLTRKHDQTNRNILEMAEERTRDKDELDKLRKKETQMRSIIQSMREQGRGTSQDIPPEIDDEGTESDYEDEYEDEEEDEEGSFEGEELATELSKPVFGPVPPPAISEARPNGSKVKVNGVKY
jgi:uncharacterized phage infection (PIP) family protein YhgE